MVIHKNWRSLQEFKRLIKLWNHEDFPLQNVQKVRFKY